MTPDTIKQYAEAAESVGKAMVPYATIVTLFVGVSKTKRFGDRKQPKRNGRQSPDQQDSEEPSRKRTKRGFASFVIYLISAATYYYAAYLGWGHPSVRAVEWMLITITMVMISIVVDDEPLAKPNVLWLVCVVVVLILEVSALTFGALQYLDKRIPSAPQTTVKSTS